MKSNVIYVVEYSPPWLAKRHWRDYVEEVVGAGRSFLETRARYIRKCSLSPYSSYPVINRNK